MSSSNANASKDGFDNNTYLDRLSFNSSSMTDLDTFSDRQQSSTDQLNALIQRSINPHRAQLIKQSSTKSMPATPSFKESNDEQMSTSMTTSNLSRAAVNSKNVFSFDQIIFEPNELSFSRKSPQNINSIEDIPNASSSIVFTQQQKQSKSNYSPNLIEQKQEHLQQQQSPSPSAKFNLMLPPRARPPEPPSQPPSLPPRNPTSTLMRRPPPPPPPSSDSLSAFPKKS